MQADIGVKKNNRYLNYLKGIACIGVVFMHIPFPGMIGNVIINLARFAVPLFFMISGYYLWDSDKNVILQRIPRKIGRLLKLTMISFIVYFLYAIVFEREAFKIITYKNIIKLIAINTTGDILHIWHIWFLLALIYTYAIIFLLLKWNKMPPLKSTIVILLIIRSIIKLITEYGHVLQQSYLLGGLPYVLLGMHLAKTDVGKFANKKNKRIIYSLLFLGMLFNCLGAIDIWIAKISEIGTIVYSVCVFVLGIWNSDRVISLSIEKIGDRYSLFVYVMHLCVGRIIDKISYGLGYEDNLVYLWFRPVVTVVITLLLAACCSKIISNRNKCMSQ